MISTSPSTKKIIILYIVYHPFEIIHFLSTDSTFFATDNNSDVNQDDNIR